MAPFSTPRDNNGIPTKMVTSRTDGLTPMSVKAVPSTHAIVLEDGTTGSDFPFVAAERDDNRIPVMWAVSSADGKTPIPIYGNPVTGAILVKST